MQEMQQNICQSHMIWQGCSVSTQPVETFGNQSLKYHCYHMEYDTIRNKQDVTWTYLRCNTLSSS